MRKITTAALVAGAALLLACTGRTAPVVGVSSPPRPSASPSSVAGAHDRVAVPRQAVGDGLWRVGSEAAAGKWAAYPENPHCLWAVRADDTPEGFVSGGDARTLKAWQSVYATLSAGQTFETVGCGLWIRVG